MAGFGRVFCRASFRSNGGGARVRSLGGRSARQRGVVEAIDRRGVKLPHYRSTANRAGSPGPLFHSTICYLRRFRRDVGATAASVYHGLLTSQTRANNPYPRVARAAARPDRRHQGRHHKARRAASARPLLRQPVCASSRPSCRGNSPSTVRCTSGEDPNRHLMMTISEPSPREAVPLSARSSTGHGSARCDARFTIQHPNRSSPTHRSRDDKNASPPNCIVILTAQPILAADENGYKV
jgi:hypothetical protein